MATATTRKSASSNKSRRSGVSFDELRELSSRRRRSSYPTDARTERQYWLRQIAALLGDDS